MTNQEKVAVHAGMNACSTRMQLQKQTPSPGPVEGAAEQASSSRLPADSEKPEPTARAKNRALDRARLTFIVTD
jgi:hypothetical protein